jgi:hypothetical protein
MAITAIDVLQCAVNDLSLLGDGMNVSVVHLLDFVWFGVCMTIKIATMPH